jgi:UDP-N-acetylglucosamine 4,6-dehydratase/5-epimerase
VNSSFFSGKRILITGGTGSLGQALTQKLLSFDVKAIRILSRNESKQVEMQKNFSDRRLNFFIGDIRDLPRLIRSFEDVDIVFHTAALKHVPVIEYNPFESVKTNVIGTQNVIDAAIEQDIELVVGIGTDKAVSPLNTYGASKLLMEKLLTSAHNFINVNRHKTKFVALRYGNVLASSGSVFPTWITQIKNNQKVTITEPSMTRFSITMDEALNFILESASTACGGEIFVPKIKAYGIMDLKNALCELINDPGHEIIGIRPAEKIHEILIVSDEIRYTWELENKYVVFNPDLSEQKILEQYPNIKKIIDLPNYSSEFAEKLSSSDLIEMLKNSNILTEN